MGEKLAPAFMHDKYLFRRKMFAFLGAAFHVYDGDGQLVFYSRQKPFRLREDFRVYSDETMSRELLTIKTPHVLDIWAAYNVENPATGEKVGVVKRKALKSLIRDEWVFLSPDGRETGKLIETSLLGATLSRLTNLFPQSYAILSDGQEIVQVKQHFNPFILRYSMQINVPQPGIDPRLLIAAGILLAGVERRQQ